ncbi:DNA transposition protein [Ahniella affigens]|uniref:DNA transposition protein n=1 Tax=Ahniella affigens TaxID=2021234 RepID=A0A2P1PSW3_9GAMM|nr:AAA family ATPase [Ahniella affigens]AVP97938.1 DNA transposition protein [Ahniella affigens]
MSTIDLRERLRALMHEDRQITQAKIARESGLSTTTVSQWFSGTYPGDIEATETKLQQWLDNHSAQRATAEAMPIAPDYVPTPSAEKVIGALRYAQAAGDLALVYGGAGLGKTSAIRRYRNLSPNVWVATMTPASASVVTALEEIADAVGVSGALGGGAAKLHRAICKRIAETAGLIVIDEAQHLSVAALDQIRSLHDATGIGVALVGNEQVYARMSGGNRAAYLDRLYSRIGKKVRLLRSTHGDIDALVGAWNIKDKACAAQLTEIGSKPGALRILTKVLRLASMYATAQQRAMCCDDIRAAWLDLGGVE